MPADFFKLGDYPRRLVSYPKGATRDEQRVLYLRRLEQEGLIIPELKEEDDDSSLLRTGAGLAAEIGIGESAKMAGLAAGSALGPIGSVVGYTSGAIVGGVSGSFARQRIDDPDAPISYGEVVRDTIINLIPFGLSKVGKTAGLASRVVGHGAAGGVVGGGIGAGGLAVQSMIDEGKLPTEEALRDAGITGAVLGSGLGMSGQLASKIYSKYAGKSVGSVDAGVNAKEPSALDLKQNIDKQAETEFKLVKDDNWIKNWWLKVKTELVDSQAYMKDLTDQAAKRDPNFFAGASDVYTAGRAAQIQSDQALKFLVDADQIDMQLLNKAATETGLSTEVLHKKLQDYMHAKHAVEYHTKLNKTADNYGASGNMTDGTKMTNKKAKEIIDHFESPDGHGDKLSDSLKHRLTLANHIADVQKAGGLLKGGSEYLKYDFYVPLNRQLDDKQFMSRAIGDLRSTGIYQRKESTDDLVVDVYQNLLDRNQDAINRAARNQRSLAMKRMLDQADGALDEVAIVTPRKARGKFFEELRDGDVSVFEDGKQFVIRFADTPYKQIAATLKGIDKAEVGTIVQLGVIGNRALGSLYTRYNPAFWAPNMVRDRMESFVNTAAKIGYLKSAKILDPFSMAADMRTVWKNLRKGGEVAQDANDKLYAEFVREGGSVGNLGLSTRKNIEDSIKTIDASTRASGKAKQGALSKAIDNINSVFEDTTRFSVYKQAKAFYSQTIDDVERVKKLSLIAARDSSFDPRLGGTRQKHLSAAFLFANPAIQGSRNVFRSLKDPKIAAGVGASMVGTSMLLDWWNSSIDPDWKNKIKGGPEKSAWRLSKHLIILSPFQDETGELKYVQAPVPYPLIPIKTVSDFTSDLSRGRDIDPVALVKEVKDAFIDGYSPTGSSIVPTLLDKAFVAPLSSNKDGLGRDIIPQYMFEMKIPDNQKYGAWMADTYGGQIMIEIAQEVEKLGMEVSPETIEYIYENSLGGAGGFMKRLINLTANLWNGKPVRRNELPIFRRFLGRTYADGFEQLTGITPDVSHFEREQNTLSVQNSRRHFDLLKELRAGRNNQERQMIYNNLIRGENKSVQRRLKKSLIDMSLGITKTDRDVRALGVENGQRAAFFQKQMSGMNPAQIREYATDQTRKKIMTPEVKRQLRILGAFNALY